VPAGGIGGGAGLRQRQLRKQVPASTIASSETANQRRSAYAAATGVARVRAAMGLLHDGTREHLLAAGRLRLEHPQASLEELGAFADPPMTKDAVAGRQLRTARRCRPGLPHPLLAAPRVALAANTASATRWNRREVSEYERAAL